MEWHWNTINIYKGTRQGRLTSSLLFYIFYKDMIDDLSCMISIAKTVLTMYVSRTPDGFEIVPVVCQQGYSSLLKNSMFFVMKMIFCLLAQR